MAQIPATLDVPFSLPSIGNTSPLFDADAFEPITKRSQAEPTQPSTPPRSAAVTSPLSPSRIPDFDFEGLSGHSFGDLSAELTASQAFKMVEDALPALGQALPSGLQQTAAATTREEMTPSTATAPPEQSTLPRDIGGTTTRVRQRISKDMIRQKLEQQKAQAMHEATAIPADVSTVTFIEKALLDKDLPLPPGLIPTASKVAKSATTAPTRPILRDRESTPSAQDVLQKARAEGSMHSPKSALDRLVSDFSGTNISAVKTDREQASLTSPIAVRHAVSEESISTPTRANSVKPTHEMSDIASPSRLANHTVKSTPESRAADKKRSQTALGVHGRRSQSTGDARPQSLVVSSTITMSNTEADRTYSGQARVRNGPGHGATR